jgi:hypothetical protein
MNSPAAHKMVPGSGTAATLLEIDRPKFPRQTT